MYQIVKSIAICTVPLLTQLSFCQEHVVNINSLVEDTQISTGEADEIKLYWWIPVEFWKATFTNDPSMTEKGMEEVVDLLSPYSMFAVVEGTVGMFGGVTYTSYDDIFDIISIQSNDSEKKYPILSEDIHPDIESLMLTFKPILTGMMGPLGENMHFFVFSDIDKDDRICDPFNTGKITLNLGDEQYSWRTPLGSLLPSKTCPVDQEILSGAWTFCPWHGEKLKSISDQ